MTGFYGNGAAAGADPEPKAHKSGLHFSYSELWDLETNYYRNYLYPNNLKQVNMVNSTLFAEDVQGRVDVTREFYGRELNTEYVFGLFSDPNQFSLLGIPVAYEIQKFAAYDNIAATSTKVTFNHTYIGFLTPVVIDTFLTFNGEGQIWQYDAVFKWMNGWLDVLVRETQRKYNASTPKEAENILRDIMVSSTCQVHEDHCHGDDQQYDSFEACVDYLTHKTRLGTAYELGADTLVCRTLHKVMLSFRPKVHCPHIGPSGGGMCSDDRTYVGVIEEEYFTHTPFVSSREEK